MARFSERLIRTDILDREFGRSLRRVQETRLAADYRTDAVTDTDAEEAVVQAERFLDIVLATFGRGSENENDLGPD